MIRTVALLLDQKKVSCKLSSADSSQLCRVLLATHKTRLHSNSAHTLIGEAEHPFAGVTRGQAQTFPLPNMMRARTSASLPQLHDLWPFTTSAEVFMFISASVWPRPAIWMSSSHIMAVNGHCYTNSDCCLLHPVCMHTQACLFGYVRTFKYIPKHLTTIITETQNPKNFMSKSSPVMGYEKKPQTDSHNRNFIKLHKLYYCLWSAWLCLFIIFGLLLRITSNTCSCWLSSSKA